jgi:hypothetical protein
MCTRQPGACWTAVNVCPRYSITLALVIRPGSGTEVPNGRSYIMAGPSSSNRNSLNACSPSSLREADRRARADGGVGGVCGLEHLGTWRLFLVVARARSATRLGPMTQTRLDGEPCRALALFAERPEGCTRAIRAIQKLYTPGPTCGRASCCHEPLTALERSVEASRNAQRCTSAARDPDGHAPGRLHARPVGDDKTLWRPMPE